MTTYDTLNYRFAHCQAKQADSEAMRQQNEAMRNIYGTPDYVRHLSYLDPRLAQNVVDPGERDWDGKRKPLPRRADDYKRKGG
jgi:hypothetical protein